MNAGSLVTRTLVPLAVAALVSVTATDARGQSDGEQTTPVPVVVSSIAATPDPGAVTPPPATDAAAQAPAAAPAPEPKPAIDIYGAAMLDMGFQVEQNNPDWFDVVRPSKLPSFKHEFGRDGHNFAGFRQSRMGVKTTTPTTLGDLKTTFEFELFGVGVDAGQTTFRLRDVWGQLGHFGAGQTDSPFMDGSIFPNSLEYWGPNGMVYFKNVQFRYMPLQGDNELVFAAERPGASGDAGIFAQRIELQNVQGRFPSPDFSTHYRATRPWGHVQLAGIVRIIRWDDLVDDQIDLSGKATGWGVDLTSNIKLGADTVHLGAVYGEGIENYMNDAPIDVATVPNLGNRVTPIRGKTLPILGLVAFYDRTWSDKWTSSAGYSRVDIDTTSGQLPSDFKRGEYALGNLLYYPVKNVLVGGEFQWARRDNHSDGFRVDDKRVQFSFKYSFSYKVGGQS
ncbi:MAG TPA: DcaP family trimeric outer membrane transporter [Vicinamibacterales bacterium]|jgi:outer membrane DcaP-like protein|nr:DcaP family trimeric outer membrane transporter [Vicinamibacterales bacterium]